MSGGSTASASMSATVMIPAAGAATVSRRARSICISSARLAGEISREAQRPDRLIARPPPPGFGLIVGEVLQRIQHLGQQIFRRADLGQQARRARPQGAAVEQHGHRQAEHRPSALGMRALSSAGDSESRFGAASSASMSISSSGRREVQAVELGFQGDHTMITPRGSEATVRRSVGPRPQGRDRPACRQRGVELDASLAEPG